MGYPQKLLADNEEVAFELRPHWRSLVAPIFWLVVIVAVASFLLSRVRQWFGDDSTVLTIVRVAVIVVGLFLLFFLVVRPILTWWTTQYVFTSRRIIIRTGFVARQGRDMPLSKVNNVMFEHSVWERMLNCGTLIIESASEHGMLVVANVPNVEEVQREVYRLHDEDDAFRVARSEMYSQQLREGQMPEPLAHHDGADADSPQQPSRGD